MPISNEDRQKYIDFIQEQVNLLQSLDIKGDTALWHYTTGESLLNIIESGKLFATQVSCLNDSTEIRYGSKLLRDSLLSVRTTKQLPLEESHLLERLIKGLVDEPDTPSHAPSPWFVTCFSERRDDLSQWRAYSGGENGYAIGFLAGGFFNRQNSLVVRVNYHENTHKQVAANVAETTFRFFREGLDSGRMFTAMPIAPIGGYTPEKERELKAKAWADEFLPEWEQWVSRLAPMMKDPSFHDEHEYRIVHQLQVSELPELRYRQKQSLMSRHLPMIYPVAGAATESRRLPVHEILVGPSRHKEISAVSVKTFMGQKGYAHVPVSVSKIPFQTT
jgi:hypothetical protein